MFPFTDWITPLHNTKKCANNNSQSSNLSLQYPWVPKLAASSKDRSSFWGHKLTYFQRNDWTSPAPLSLQNIEPLERCDHVPVPWSFQRGWTSCWSSVVRKRETFHSKLSSIERTSVTRNTDGFFGVFLLGTAAKPQLYEVWKSQLHYIYIFI